ncbi:autotransporter outer membrane beta-barrel domain-containing protein [Rouxiella sp. WC2420]|uniref:Autotransporter outer membrane beta-barrel domain-containing protein n=1 Tax=Rouxiella sp. WC2420 TaxID=3234145 RepID=A0AB39VTJ8_9GAMM
MRNVMRLSKLSQCILLATSSLMIAGNASAATPVLKLSEQASGLTQTKSGANHVTEWNLDHLNGNAAVLAKTAENHNVYFSGPGVADIRASGDKQELVVAGTDLSGSYINMSKGGSANLYLLPGSKVDMVGIGDSGAKTDATVILNNAALLGQKTSHKYDDKSSTAYMHGAAIWVDKLDNGNINIIADNQSMINGNIFLRGTGDKNITLDNSVMTNGTIASSGKSLNNVIIENSQIIPETYNMVDENSVSSTQIDDAIELRKANENHVGIINSKIKGGKDLRSESDSDLFIENKSIDSGYINIAAGGKAALDISDSIHNGDITILGKKGATVFITDHAQSTGDVSLGNGNNLLTVSNNSLMTGNVIADNKSKTSMTVGNNSQFLGSIAGVKKLSIVDNSQIVTHELKDMHIAMNDHAKLLATDLNHSNIDMSSNSQFNITHATGENTVTVNNLSADATAGMHALGEVNASKGATVTTKFANDKQTVSARNGAYNNDLAILEASKKSKAGADQQKTVLVVKRTELANDVQSNLAGLDGAKQSAVAVTNSIANRMNTLNASNLFNGVHEGASVWGDYLYQNANLKGNTESASTLQGLNTGADWTWKLANGDSLTSGMSLAQVKNKLSNASAYGNYNNHVTGNFYSLYGGWQQALQNKTWSLFTNANLSYGKLSYSANSNNVGASTSGIKEHLNSAYKGKVLNGEVRSGITIMATKNIAVQPYAILGMNKATSDEYANTNIKFSNNKSGSWYAGIGTRVTGDVDVKSIKLMPWADVSYTQEFADKTSIAATSAATNGDFQSTKGKMRKVVSAGAGVNAAVTNNLNLNSGIYTSAGDTSKDVSVRLGVNYNF